MIHLDLDIDPIIEEKLKQLACQQSHGNVAKVVEELICREVKRLEESPFQEIVGLLSDLSEEEVLRFEETVKRRPLFGKRKLDL